MIGHVEALQRLIWYAERLQSPFDVVCDCRDTVIRRARETLEALQSGEWRHGVRNTDPRVDALERRVAALESHHPAHAGRAGERRDNQ